VIHEHATIGIVITTDGSIGDLPRESFLEPEEKTIRELQSIGKPFVVLVNSQRPYSEEAKNQASELEERYKVKAMAVNCEQLREDDIHTIMKHILFEFPVSEIEFYIPKWVEMLARDHKIKQDLLHQVKEMMGKLLQIKDASAGCPQIESEYIEQIKIEDICMHTGCVRVKVDMIEGYYYEILSEMTGTSLQGEYELMKLLKQMSAMKKEYEQVQNAMDSVRLKGYGVVTPLQHEIHLEDPILIKQGNKYGVKIHSEAPSIHMIRANIETDIAPIVGSEKQAEDLVVYIKNEAASEGGIWNTNIFGKSIQDLVSDGMRNKMAAITDESQIKLQDTMQKIVNDSNGGMVCIII
ncbi:MAG: stage IV sporulation protein A, partial [Lachnospiraceae bacterium]